MRRLLVIAIAASGIGMSAPRAADDPFADELNPFGKGTPASPSLPRRPEPPAVPEEPEKSPQRPSIRLPVPFPEADRGAARDDSGAKPADVPDRGRRGRPSAADDAAVEPPSRTEAEDAVAEADRLEQAGKLEEARQRLREAIKLDPSLTMAHLALGVVSRRLNDFTGCVDACSAGIAVDPLEPELYLRRGIAWFHLGMFGIALEDFEEAAGIAYDDPRPELWRGLVLTELARPLEAINAYAAAIRRDKTYMLAYLNRGLAYLATNEPRKAEMDFDQAIRQKPKDARAWAHRGVAQARQGRFREAIDSYEAALSITPDDRATQRNLEAARRLARSGPQPRSW